jgi:hypothetical protein
VAQKVAVVAYRRVDKGDGSGNRLVSPAILGRGLGGIDHSGAYQSGYVAVVAPGRPQVRVDAQTPKGSKTQS